MSKRALISLVVGWLSLGLGGGASAAGDSSDGSSGLSDFAGCPQLKRYLVNTAMREARLQLERGNAFYPGMGEDGAVRPSSPPQNQEGAASPVDFSDTNVQEAGVDEPDLVKTDGDHLYLVNGGYLLMVDSWPAKEMRELARVKMEGDPLGLFLAGDLALVVSNVWRQAALDDGLSFAPAPYSALTKATLVDLTDRTSPKVVREIYLEGSYGVARLIDGRVHLVVNSVLPIYNIGGALPPSAMAESNPVRKGDARSNEVRKFGRALLRKNLRDLAPKREDRRLAASGEYRVETGPISACEDFYRPDVPNGSNTVSVVTLDLNDPQGDLHSVTLVSDYGEVYAAADSLYIAALNAGAWYWGAAEPKETTAIHEFTLGAEPKYVASGSVEGWIVNRYAMSEYDGYFRIATTTGMWGWGGDGPRNRLYVMSRNGDRLDVTATLDGLGHEGERIYAVRYDGDRGYLVTFRQTDPLYTLDLSDPAAPRVAGELEIPGFSTYLHPIADGYLLAIGQNTEKGGGDLSLFDVRNPALPALVDREWLGEGSWSEAMYEPHAFTYFAPLKQLALPLQQWFYTPMPVAGGVALPPVGFNGTVVFDVDLSKGLVKRGAVDHSEFFDAWSWGGNVQRNLYIGDAGGYALYSLSQAALKASDAGTLKDLASIELPGKDGWNGPVVYGEEPVPVE